jgi:hypothetical protein
MKNLTVFLALLIIGNVKLQAKDFCDSCMGKVSVGKINETDYKVIGASVTHNKKWGQLEFEITVQGKAGATVSKPAGQMDGAPVDAYVFVTTLKSEDVGFSKTDGIVALALTAHPDFDDTPLFDENGDGDYLNDQIHWHPHWVILVEDKRVAGGFAVKQYDKADTTVKLPPTNPGLPAYFDSPGFQVVTAGNAIRVVVPDFRVRFKSAFKFDALSSYLQVNTSKPALPLLGVYKVYNVLSKNLSLPYSVKQL